MSHTPRSTRSTRPSARLLGLLAAAVAVVVTAAVAAVALSDGTSPTASPSSTSSTDDDSDEITPAPQDAADDTPDFYDDGCQLDVGDAKPRDCAYGVPESEAEATIAVVGDSKAGQWVPALEVLAEKHRWRLEIYTKSACPAVSDPVAQDGQVYESCTDFNQAVDRQLRADPVDLVLTTSSRDSAVSGTDADGKPELSKDLFISSLQETWRGWTAAGSKVLVVSDTPKPADPADPSEIFEVPDCVAEHLDDLGACSFDRAAGLDLSGHDAQETAVDAVDDADVTWLDTVPWVCPTDTCEPVIDGVLVYRDGSHLTRTYVETLAPRFEEALVAAGLP